MPALQVPNGRHEHTDNEHLRRRHITYEVIRQTAAVDADTDPTPVTVLELARSRPDRDALNPGSPPSAHRQRQLA